MVIAEVKLVVCLACLVINKFLLNEQAVLLSHILLRHVTKNKTS